MNFKLLIVFSMFSFTVLSVTAEDVSGTFNGTEVQTASEIEAQPGNETEVASKTAIETEAEPGNGDVEQNHKEKVPDTVKYGEYSSASTF